MQSVCCSLLWYSVRCEPCLNSRFGHVLPWTEWHLRVSLKCEMQSQLFGFRKEICSAFLPISIHPGCQLCTHSFVFCSKSKCAFFCNSSFFFWRTVADTGQKLPLYKWRVWNWKLSFISHQTSQSKSDVKTGKTGNFHMRAAWFFSELAVNSDKRTCSD